MNSSVRRASSSGLKDTSSKQKQNPYNFARMTIEPTLSTEGASLLTVPRMISSGGYRAGCRNARSTALSTSGNASNSRSRMVMASARAWSDSLRSRIGRRRPASHTSAGRATQSHSTESPRNSKRRSRSGARENSPNRILLRIPRTKSATAHNGFICIPSFSFAGRRTGWQSQEYGEFQHCYRFQDEWQAPLQPQKQQERHHRKPLPAGTPQSFPPARKPQ